MRKIIICGKAGSGKTFLRQKYKDKGYLPGIQGTTRFRRKGEVYGYDYYFVTQEKFRDTLLYGTVLEYSTFNDWIYYTTTVEFKKKDVFIMSPESINSLSEKNRKFSFVIYLDLDIDARRTRLFDRNDSNDEVERRIQADELQFANFTNYDLRITNPDF